MDFPRGSSSRPQFLKICSRALPRAAVLQKGSGRKRHDARDRKNKLFGTGSAERVRLSGAKKDESKHPENASLAMLFQGILSRMLVLPCCAMRDGSFFKYWVYIVGSRTGTLYTGMTGFFDARIGQHKSGLIEGFSQKYGCDRLLYYEGYSDVGRAKRRELQVKGWRRDKKIALIEKMNPRWEDLAEHWGREVLLRRKSIKKTP